MKISIIDDDGNDIPVPDPGSDVMKLIYLLEYCRKRRFRLGENVQIGEVTVQVVDLDLAMRGDAGESRVRGLDPNSDMAKVLMGDE